MKFKHILITLLLATSIVPAHSMNRERHHHSDTTIDNIFYAAGWDGNWRDVKKYLAARISVNARDYDGSTPLIHAAYWGRRGIVQKLIALGADVNAQDRDGWTALMYAAKWDKHEVVADLLKAGANPNMIANDGSTALMDAAYIMWGSKKAAQYLVAAKADLDVQDKYGYTALMYAARYGYADRCSLFLNAGADATLEDNDGQTALDIAIEQLKHADRSESKSDLKDRYEVVRLLEAHAVKPKIAKPAKPSAPKPTTPQPKPVIKKRTTRWARWKAKIIAFFTRKK